MGNGSKGNIVYGVHAVDALILRRPEAILRASFLDRNFGERSARLEAAIRILGIPIQRLSRNELDRLSLNGVHQGVVVEISALKEFTIRNFENLVLRLGSAFRGLLLDGIQDPRNLGACLRTADAAGVHAAPRRPPARAAPA